MYVMSAGVNYERTDDFITGHRLVSSAVEGYVAFLKAGDWRRRGKGNLLSKPVTSLSGRKTRRALRAG